jgi:outer membrane immunogenic protein
MRKHSLMLLAAATIGLAATQAVAADLPRRAAPAPAYVPPAPPPITWTGCYIGANVGGIFSQGDAHFNGVEVSRSNSGFAGGGQIGCDYQWAGTGWVIGFRNMFDGTSLHRDRTFFDPFSGFSGTADFHLNWFDTLTTRLGYAFAPGWLIYGQGGIAWAHTQTDVTIAGLQVGDRSRNRANWTAGGGVEWMFAPHWSAFLEGNWMDVGSRNDTTIFSPGACNFGCNFSAKASAATVLVGVNYRFGWLGKGKAPYY